MTGGNLRKNPSSKAGWILKEEKQKMEKSRDCHRGHSDCSDLFSSSKCGISHHTPHKRPRFPSASSSDEKPPPKKMSSSDYKHRQFSNYSVKHQCGRLKKLPPGPDGRCNHFCTPKQSCHRT